MFSETAVEKNVAPLRCKSIYTFIKCLLRGEHQAAAEAKLFITVFWLTAVFLSGCQAIISPSS